MSKRQRQDWELDYVVTGLTQGQMDVLQDALISHVANMAGRIGGGFRESPSGCRGLLAEWWLDSRLTFGILFADAWRVLWRN